MCIWIGKGGADRSDPYGLGQDLARLHSELARPDAGDFTDRRLTFERGPVPSPDQELPHWYVARHLWRDRILPRQAQDLASLRPQPIHGELHWDNVAAGSGGGRFGFIDFDKVMHAPPVFDLAKLARYHRSAGRHAGNCCPSMRYVRDRTGRSGVRARLCWDLLAGLL
ncbi:phosphotransferase [Streptomyces sp. NPDC001939]